MMDQTFRELFETSDPMGIAMMDADISELPEIEIKGNPENAERFVGVTVMETVTEGPDADLKTKVPGEVTVKSDPPTAGRRDDDDHGGVGQSGEGSSVPPE